MEDEYYSKERKSAVAQNEDVFLDLCILVIMYYKMFITVIYHDMYIVSDHTVHVINYINI